MWNEPSSVTGTVGTAAAHAVSLGLSATERTFLCVLRRGKLTQGRSQVHLYTSSPQLTPQIRGSFSRTFPNLQIPAAGQGQRGRGRSLLPPCFGLTASSLPARVPAHHL